MPSFVFTTFWTEARQRGKTVFDRDVCPSTANTLYSSILSRWEHWESRGNKLIASRTFPAPQAAGMSAYNVCVREIIKKKPRIFSRKVKLRGQVWSFEDNFSAKNKISRQTSEPERCLFILWPPPPPHPILLSRKTALFPIGTLELAFFRCLCL